MAGTSSTLLRAPPKSRKSLIVLLPPSSDGRLVLRGHDVANRSVLPRRVFGAVPPARMALSPSAPAPVRARHVAGIVRRCALGRRGKRQRDEHAGEVASSAPRRCGAGTTWRLLGSVGWRGACGCRAPAPGRW